MRENYLFFFVYFRWPRSVRANGHLLLNSEKVFSFLKTLESLLVGKPGDILSFMVVHLCKVYAFCSTNFNEVNKPDINLTAKLL